MSMTSHSSRPIFYLYIVQLLVTFGVMFCFNIVPHYSSLITTVGTVISFIIFAMIGAFSLVSDDQSSRADQFRRHVTYLGLLHFFGTIFTTFILQLFLPLQESCIIAAVSKMFVLSFFFHHTYKQYRSEELSIKL